MKIQKQKPSSPYRVPRICLGLLVAGAVFATTFRELLFPTDSGIPKGYEYLSLRSTYRYYQPAPVEEYVLQNAQQLQLTKPKMAPTCHIWNDPTSTPFYQPLQNFLSELQSYFQMVENLNLGIKDMRTVIARDDHHGVCEKVKLHPDGLPGLFPKSQQSVLSNTTSGFVEPLMVPMRHPLFCKEKVSNPDSAAHILRMDYLIHDFYTMCRQLKPTSRTVLIDMGADVSFHPEGASTFWLVDLYQKFGFSFDHIYAYEMTQIKPKTVFSNIPKRFEASYHWINVGVSADIYSRQNPFNMLKENFNQDDLVIVKLDIDTPHIENVLAKQVRDDPELAKLIDHFYFEHHVNQAELDSSWQNSTEGTVAESLTLFQDIRKKGIAAHFWI